MPRESSVGECSSCHSAFAYYLIHNGFNETAYAYCDRCGMTAFLNRSSAAPREAQIVFHRRIASTVEPFLAPCACGGRFSAIAGPRCPSCRSGLNPIDAGQFIERNAPGAANGWTWQGNWHDAYAIVIDGRVRQDPWLQGTVSPA